MAIDIHPVHQRLGELWYKRKHEGLTRDEEKELELCLDWNTNRCLAAAKLYNLSLAAHITDDVDWQHNICQRIDQLMEG